MRSSVNDALHHAPVGEGCQYDVHGRLGIEGMIAVEAAGQGGQPLRAAQWSAHQDNLVGSGTITIALESGIGATSPLMSVSSFGDLRAIPGRDFQLETATVPKGATPGGADWWTVFYGEIDAVEMAGEELTLYCRDKMCVPQDRIIEPDDTSDPPVSGFQAGNATLLQAVRDIQQAVAVYASDMVNFPIFQLHDPQWTVIPYWQDALMSVAEAWQRLVQMRGFAIHWRYVPGFHFLAGATLYDPTLVEADNVYTVDRNEILRYARLRLDRAPVRNVTSLVYGQNREVYTTSDPTSIVVNGRRYMRFSEPAGNPIDTLEEATTLGDLALAQQKDPGPEVDYERFYFWPVELADQHIIQADGRRFDQPLEQAVIGYQHNLDWRVGGRFRSTIQTRHRAMSAIRRWRQPPPKMVHLSTLEPQGSAPQGALWLQYIPEP